MLVKLAMREGATSKRAVGKCVQGFDFPFVGIQPFGLMLCSGWDDSHHDAQYTSALIALFLDEATAHECLKAGDACKLDPRWRDQTKRVLVAIGDDHPDFRVRKDSQLGFPSDTLNKGL